MQQFINLIWLVLVVKKIRKILFLNLDGYLYDKVLLNDIISYEMCL